MAIPTNIDLANKEKAGLNDDLPRRKKDKRTTTNTEESIVLLFFPHCAFSHNEDCFMYY